MTENSQQQPKKKFCAHRCRGPGRPFQPGASGNPGGRPKVIGEVRDAARKHTRSAIATLLVLMRSSQKDEVRSRAAEALLDRAWGRPPQAITGEDGSALALRLQLEAGGGDLLARLRALAVGAVLEQAAPAESLPAVAGEPSEATDHLPVRQAAERTSSNGGTCEPAVRAAVLMEAPAPVQVSPKASAEVPRTVAPCADCGGSTLLAPGETLCPGCAARERLRAGLARPAATRKAR